MICLTEQKLLEAKDITEKAAITEESLRQLLSQFEDHVAKRDIPEIKKFIASYVEKVIVYEKHVEVILRSPLWICCMEVRGVLKCQLNLLTKLIHEDNLSGTFQSRAPSANATVRAD